MKKVIAIVLALVMLASFAACGKKTTDGNAPETNAPETNAPETSAPETDAPTADTNAVDVLSTIFATYAEDKKFPIGGGDEANMSMEGPAKYDVALAEELNNVVQLPASQNANIEEAATVMNMMNANSFTGAAYLLKEGTDAAVFADDFKAGLDTAQWMCGFPEKFVVIKAGGYVITAYGLADNIEYFKTQAAAAHADAEVLLEGDIAA